MSDPHIPNPDQEIDEEQLPEEGGIFEACTSGDLERVQELLEEDPALANLEDELLGSTPLIFAAHRGHSQIVALLLVNGADTEAQERASGTTALHWASEGGHPDVVEMLLEHGAGIDVIDEWYNLGPVGWATVVYWAPHFHEDREATAELLINSGARLDPFSAIQRGDLIAFQSLLDEDPAAATEKLGFAARGQLPVHFAASRGRADFLRALAAGGADLNALNDWGMSPLALARKNNEGAAERALLESGAEEDLSSLLFGGEFESAKEAPLDPGHENLILSCAEEGSAEAIAILLDKGADPNRQAIFLLNETPNSATALHLAALSGHVEAVEALLKRGSDINAASDPTGMTPLHCAASRGQVDVIKLLLLNGAEAAAVDTAYGVNPEGWAQSAGHHDAVAIFQAFEAYRQAGKKE